MGKIGETLAASIYVREFRGAGETEVQEALGQAVAQHFRQAQRNVAAYGGISDEKMRRLASDYAFLAHPHQAHMTGLEQFLQATKEALPPASEVSHPATWKALLDTVVKL